MVDTFGDALRALRVATGQTLSAFAKKVNFSKGYVGNVETGERPPTRDFAEACDKALGTTPLLSMLVDDVGGSNVNRRKLLGNIGFAAGASAIAGSQVLADLVRHGLLDAASDPNPRVAP